MEEMIKKIDTLNQKLETLYSNIAACLDALEALNNNVEGSF